MDGIGMDPMARRFMWDIISRITNTDRECSVILTTHSMEEAEALCNNIGIMVRTQGYKTVYVHPQSGAGQRAQGKHVLIGK